LKTREALFRKEQAEFESSADSIALRQRKHQQSIGEQISMINVRFEKNCEKMRSAHAIACAAVKAKIAEESAMRKTLVKEKETNWKRALSQRSSEFLEKETFERKQWVEAQSKVHLDIDTKLTTVFARSNISRDQMQDPKMRSREELEIRMDKEKLIRLTSGTSEAFGGHCQRILSSRSVWSSYDGGFGSTPSSARKGKPNDSRGTSQNSSWRRQLSARAFS
jgi:hypothetical protein